MPDNDPLQRYLDAGMAFTQMTRQRAEDLVRDLTHNGEISRDQAAAWVEDLLDRSRQSTETLLHVIRTELDERISQLNLVTRDDLANLAARLTGAAPAKGGRRSPGTSGGPDASKTAKKTAEKATAADKAAKKSAAAPNAGTSTKRAPSKKATTSAAKKATTGAAKKATASAAKTATTGAAAAAEKAAAKTAGKSASSDGSAAPAGRTDPKA